MSVDDRLDVLSSDWLFASEIDPRSLLAESSSAFNHSESSSSEPFSISDHVSDDHEMPSVSLSSSASQGPPHHRFSSFDISSHQEACQSYEARIVDMQRDQAGVLLHQMGSAEILGQQQAALQSQIANTTRVLSQVFNTEMLQPLQLVRIYKLTQYLRFLSVQLSVLQEELIVLTSSKSSGGSSERNQVFARLWIVSQPLTGVISKAKAGCHVSTVVKLVIGVTYRSKFMSKMTVGTIIDESSAFRHQTPSTTKFLEQDSAPLEVVRCQTIWHHRFVTGTRKKLAYLQYSLCLGITEPQPQIKLRSELSRPFIVITNDCQWHEAEAASLQNTLFSRVSAVPWLLFVNTVHSHFIAATRQDPEDSVRPIYPIEWAYFRQTFFENGATVSAAQFQTFWDWFGKCVQKLRYQPQLLPLFRQGCLSFLPKRSSLMTTRMLQQPPGTFCLRFSESVPGKVAVAYRASSKPSTDSIRHYMPQSDDPTAAKPALADFIRDQPSLTHIIRSEPNPHEFLFQTFPKDQILAPFYTKRSTGANVNGYDSQIVIARDIFNMIE